LHSGWISSGGLVLKADILELHDVADVIDWNTTSSLPTADGGTVGDGTGESSQPRSLVVASEKPAVWKSEKGFDFNLLQYCLLTY